jgi:hypothetical protein
MKSKTQGGHGNNVCAQMFGLKAVLEQNFSAILQTWQIDILSVAR